MEHLLYEPTAGGECNVCEMVFYYKFKSVTEIRNWILVNFLYI